MKVAMNSLAFLIKSSFRAFSFFVLIHITGIHYRN